MTGSYVYEIDPYNKKITKLDLTKELKKKLGVAHSHQVQDSYLFVYDNFSGEKENNKEWFLDIPNLPKNYEGFHKRLTYHGKCYLAGCSYKVGGRDWKVLEFPRSFENYFRDWLVF